MFFFHDVGHDFTTLCVCFNWIYIEVDEILRGSETIARNNGDDGDELMMLWRHGQERDLSASWNPDITQQRKLVDTNSLNKKVGLCK